MADPEHGTSGGVELTEERVRELAEQAQRGYDTERLRKRSRRGRPPLGQEAATVFHVRLQPSLRAALERRADEEETTPSDLVRRALRNFLDANSPKLNSPANAPPQRRELGPTIWAGAVRFGLVEIPVKLYAAVSSKSLNFHPLARDEDGNLVRVTQKQVTATTGEEVPPEEVLEGYEISPGQYLVIEREELVAFDPEASRAIDIEDFVDLQEIDPIYFDRPYYLGPGDLNAAKPYRLLVEAMEESNKVAIASFVMRGDHYLGAIRAKDGILLLSTMNYADEIVDRQTVDGLDDLDEVEVKDREREMAKQLIESLTSEFEPDKYEDEYRQRVLDLIEAKAAGEEIVLRQETEKAKVVDLMAALEESIESAKLREQEAG